MNFTQTTRTAALTLIAAALLTACSSRTAVDRDGQPADELKWPKWDSVTFHKKRGTFPDLGSLNQTKPGLTKDELYYLLGRPHYDEMWRPREWNYLFHFHTPGQGTDGVTTCQFKLLFDKNMRVGSTHWNPVDPSHATCPPAPPQPVAAPANVPTVIQERYTLGSDALFAFNRSGENDILPRGREELDQLAAKLQGFSQLNSVTVIGHTDYLGSDSYNQNLSQERANTVSRYLANRGIPAHLIRSVGMGESQPVKECDNRGGRSALISCLQPNRRVEVQVDGYGIRR